MLRSRASLVILSSLVIAVLGGCEPSASSPRAAEEGIHVVAAFYPLVYALERVGGSLVSVDNLTAAGVEPHDLELSAHQVRALSEADLVVYLGGGFQPALEDFVSGLDPGKKLDVLEGLDLAEGGDPHVWLDPTMMADLVDRVGTRMIEIDPDHAATYERNVAELVTELIALDTLLGEGLRNCETRDIVTSHAAFGYLAARYDLDQVSISGIDPEGEPSPGRMAAVARFVRANDVRTIFFEELVSPEVAETIAEETGASTAMLSPLESAPPSGDYADAMKSNLEVLAKALDCE